MRGAMWEFWIFGTVAAFIALMIWMPLTPFFNLFTAEAARMGSFADPTINTSFHNTLTYNTNLWNLWPIAIVAMVFLLFFIAASGDDELEQLRRG